MSHWDAFFKVVTEDGTFERRERYETIGDALVRVAEVASTLGEGQPIEALSGGDEVNLWPERGIDISVWPCEEENGHHIDDEWDYEPAMDL